MSRGLHEVMLEGVGDGGGARLDAELAKDVGDVGGGGAVSDEQRLGDLPVGAAVDEQSQDLPLAGREMNTAYIDRFRLPPTLGDGQHAFDLGIDLLLPHAAAC